MPLSIQVYFCIMALFFTKFTSFSMHKIEPKYLRPLVDFLTNVIEVLKSYNHPEGTTIWEIFMVGIFVK